MWVYLVISCLIGVFIGVTVSSIIQHVESSYGTLHVDSSDPDKDIYRLDVHGELVELRKKKYVVLRVNKDVNLSQE